jgi:predicted nuclease of predicted toxin-antitoxin system
VNFLVDAQLPRRVAYSLRDAGHDVLHTLDLPDGNRTSDAQINELSTRDSRVVVTKDTDFVNSFLLFHRPYQLLQISTGNSANAHLEDVFVGQIPTITKAFESYDYLELTRDTLIFHS